MYTGIFTVLLLKWQKEGSMVKNYFFPISTIIQEGVFEYVLYEKDEKAVKV